MKSLPMRFTARSQVLLANIILYKMILDKGNNYFMTTVATGQYGQLLVFCRCGLFPFESQKIKIKLSVVGNLQTTSQRVKTTNDNEETNIRLKVKEHSFP